MTDTPAFWMTVANADGSEAKGACTEAEAARSLATAARRGYFIEVVPNGGASIIRRIGTDGSHVVRLAPARPAGKLTPFVRRDLALIASRSAAVRVPETGRINAGYFNSIPPGASAFLRFRGLVTVVGTTVTVSLSARLAVLAQDNRTAPWAYEPDAAELRGLLAPFVPHKPEEACARRGPRARPSRAGASSTRKEPRTVTETLAVPGCEAHGSPLPCGKCEREKADHLRWQQDRSRIARLMTDRVQAATAAAETLRLHAGFEAQADEWEVGRTDLADLSALAEDALKALRHAGRVAELFSLRVARDLAEAQEEAGDGG